MRARRRTWGECVAEAAAEISRRDTAQALYGSASFTALRQRVYELEARIALIEQMECTRERVNGGDAGAPPIW